MVKLCRYKNLSGHLNLLFFFCVSFEGVEGQKTTVYIDAFTQYLMEEFSSDSNDSSSDESNDEDILEIPSAGPNLLIPTKTSLSTQGKLTSMLIS